MLYGKNFWYVGIVGLERGYCGLLGLWDMGLWNRGVMFGVEYTFVLGLSFFLPASLRASDTLLQEISNRAFPANTTKVTWQWKFYCSNSAILHRQQFNKSPLCCVGWTLYCLIPNFLSLFLSVDMQLCENVSFFFFTFFLFLYLTHLRYSGCSSKPNPVRPTDRFPSLPLF